MTISERHNINPFIKGMSIPIKGKQIQLSILGKGNDVLINQTTGEVRGTHVVTYKKVDGEQFVKLFTENISMTFELSSAGIKTFGILLWTLQRVAIAKDEIDLDVHTHAEFIKKHKENKKPVKVSLATFKRGINELEKAQIIAKAVRLGRYFINPNFIFNGNRIAFTTLIDRKETEAEAEAQRL